MPAPIAKPPTKRSWINRLLELGNHNKIIAVATLVTLATGIPFLIMSAVTAFTGSEAATREEIIAELVALQERFDSTGAAGSQGAVEVGKEGLRTLDRESRNPEATAQEQREFALALIAFGQGDERSALTMLARIAMEQEKRGANESAAAIWCQRATLQLFTDLEDALGNYQRAQILSDAGVDPYSQIEHARLLRLQLRNEECVLVLRKAIRKAHKIGDGNAEGQALLSLALRPEIGSQEGHALFVTAFDLLSKEAQQDPANLEVTRFLALSGMWGGGGGRPSGAWFHEGGVVENQDTTALLTGLQQKLDRLKARGSGTHALVAERVTLALLHTAVGHLHSAQGATELASAGFAAAQPLALSVIADSAAKPTLLRSLSYCFFPAVVYSSSIGDSAEAQRMAVGYMECCRKIFGADTQNLSARRILAFSLIFAGRYTILNEDAQGGVKLLAEAIALMWANDIAVMSPIDHATMALTILDRCLYTLPASSSEEAYSWADKGRQAWEDLNEQRRATGIGEEALQLQLVREFPVLAGFMQEEQDALGPEPPTDEG